MRKLRIVLAILLIAHGLAHASAGMWATDIGGRTLVTILWECATLGFIGGAAGLLGIRVLRNFWQQLVAAGAAASLLLLFLYSHPLFVPGIVADFALVAIALAPAFGGQLKRLAPSNGKAGVAAVALLLYAGTLIALRPWYSSWGATRSEQQMVLASDPPIGESHYRIDHAITIRAPIDSVWPWIAQIGQDRAGFYSYDWLERLFGARIKNADEIVPAWQNRSVGDLVPAVQPGYLGGVLGRDLGWRISELRSGRMMVLDGWGAFVLEPIDSATTRLHIRTRGEGVPTLAGIAMTPLSLLIFEPAHFIMERGMMLGVKRRAERLGT